MKTITSGECGCTNIQIKIKAQPNLEVMKRVNVRFKSCILMLRTPHFSFMFCSFFSSSCFWFNFLSLCDISSSVPELNRSARPDQAEVSSCTFLCIFDLARWEQRFAAPGPQSCGATGPQGQDIRKAWNRVRGALWVSFKRYAMWFPVWQVFFPPFSFKKRTT